MKRILLCPKCDSDHLKLCTYEETEGPDGCAWNYSETYFCKSCDRHTTNPKIVYETFNNENKNG